MVLQSSDLVAALVLSNLIVGIGCFYLIMENHNMLKKKRK